MNDKIPVLGYPEEDYTVFTTNSNYIRDYVEAAIFAIPVISNTIKYYNWYVDNLGGVIDTFVANGFKDDTLYDTHAQDLNIASGGITTILTLISALYENVGNGCKLYRIIEEINGLSGTYKELTKRHPWLLSKKYNSTIHVDKMLNVDYKQGKTGDLYFIGKLKCKYYTYGIFPHLTRVPKSCLDGITYLAYEAQEIMLSPWIFLTFYHNLLSLTWSDDYRMFSEINGTTPTIPTVSLSKLSKFINTVEEYMGSVEVSKLSKADIDHIIMVSDLGQHKEYNANERAIHYVIELMSKYQESVKRFINMLSI